MAEEDNDSDAPTTARKSGRSRRRKWLLLLLLLVFIIIGAVWAVYYFSVARYRATTSDAYVHGNRIQLSARVSGTVTSIAVDDTDHVDTGDVLVRLDATDARNALQQAKAQLADALRSVQQLYARLDEQKAAIRQHEAGVDQARRDYERQRELQRSHSTSRKELERARAVYQERQAALAVARHKLTELEAQTRGTTVREHPRVQQAKSDLRAAYLQLQRTQVIAPAGGHVAQRKVQVGQHVSPAQPLLTIVPATPVWIEANFKETQLAAMRIGQPATLTSDLYGGDVTYHGHVAGLTGC